MTLPSPSVTSFEQNLFSITHTQMSAPALRRQPSRVSTPTTKKVVPSLFINPNIDSFLQQFSQFIRRHILEQKSETVLVAGPPSCGKTKLLDSIFHQIQTEEIFSERLIIIRLNGLLHAIETAALQEIASQFDILTHNQSDSIVCDNLQILLETIASGFYLIFVLDHFEQFTYQKLNSILYTLFDAVYSEKKSYSILTIAVSNRADCLELPEKRLKSRFSQIYYILSAPPVDEFAQHVLDRFGATNKMRKDVHVDGGMFNSLANVEQTIVRCLRDPERANLYGNDNNRPDQQLDGCLTHLELLLLLMANNIVKRIDDKLENRIMGGNESDDDENDDDENGGTGGIKPDTKFTFDQVYHEYAKYVLKNHKYFYDKAVVRKTFHRLIERGFIRKYLGRYALIDEPLSGEHTMIMLVNSDELRFFVESKPLPAEIKRYGKLNTTI